MTRIILNKTTFVVCLLLIAIWHLWSLLYSPLPWFDETFFASITKSLLEGKGFMLEVCPIQTEGKEVLLYGPIYFILTGLSFSLFGFGIFQFRIVALVFTALSIYIFGRILKQFDISKNITQLFILLLAFDVIIIQNGHSGRMDMVALFFALTTWWAYFKSQAHIKYLWLMSIAGVAAVLTTPRIAVIVFPIFIYALIQFAKSKSWFSSAIITTLPIIIYFIWVIYAFDSINGFIDYFFISTTENNINKYSSFLGGNLYIPLYQWPLIITAIISTVILLFRKTKIQKLLLLWFPIITFYIVVTDTGAYSALIMPFWYLIVALALANFSTNNKIARTLLYSGVAVTLFVNVGIFSLKATTIVGSISERNPRPLQTWVNEHIPKNSKIVGDDRYYYACMINSCDYQYMDRVKDHATRAQYHLEHYQPDFLFISTQTPKQIIDAYKEKFTFEESWEYSPQQRNPLITKTFKRIPIPIQSSYQGTLIRITPKGKEKVSESE